MSELRIEKLHFAYDKATPVIKGIDLVLDDRTTAIIGQNGSGKTTFVKLLKGLLRPYSGRILLDGADIATMTVAQIAKKIGLVFQNPDDQIFKQTVLDEVMVGPLNIGQSLDQARSSSRAALEQVQLADVEQVNPYDLNLAQRKMVAVASILAMDTPVVIFDEPTMGQDVAGKAIIKKVIEDLHEEGKAVFCILHDMDFAAAVFERVVVFSQGQLLLEGDAREVFSKKELLQQAYLDQPQAMKIAQVLGIPGNLLTVEEVEAALKEGVNQ
ncbi:energy-coupling factor transport system ATP-binding protein [Trichococcus patagoniensis]|uniref:Energy-coupling factor transport system ATP-binding protein n=1 Tax=Trichococcus patagoniensis TaxID=382641 RepID=A0A2T5I9H3_9LACT|nr:ABC transporter ATP-binding protein [Trichococcus patagoniensis]PTQ80475.1 energy-coupling factor transport system ATP-binding protein [Trichococcus patagoniensis]